MATILDHTTHFSTLPRDFYFSQDTYDREVDRIFFGQWLYFCHVSELPAVGDYLVRELFGEHVLVMRTGTDVDALVARSGVCRHRGARLCEPGLGHTKKRLICPYHQWSYDLNGELAHAPTVPESETIAYREWGLEPFQLTVWNGFVFVCLGEDELPSFADLLGEEAREFEALAPLDMKRVHTQVFEIQANWKVVAENYVECYHCPGGHSDLCRVIQLPDRRAGEGLGIPPLEIDGASVDDTDHVVPYMYGREELLQQGKRSLSHDGEYLCATPFGGTGRAMTDDGLAIGPLVSPAISHFVFFADHGNLTEVRPVSVDRTQMISHMFVPASAEEGKDYVVESFGPDHVLHVTYREDVALCELAQSGMRSRRYRPGPLSVRLEPGVRMLLETYLDLMNRSPQEL